MAEHPADEPGPASRPDAEPSEALPSDVDRNPENDSDDAIAIPDGSEDILNERPVKSPTSSVDLDTVTDGLLLDFEAPPRVAQPTPVATAESAELPAFVAPATERPLEPDADFAADLGELDAFPGPEPFTTSSVPRPVVTRPSRIRPDVRLPRRIELDQIERPAPSERAIGIDLGTTNCCAAVVADGRAFVLTTRLGASTMPSAVYFTRDGDVILGKDALRRATTDPSMTVVGSKRLIGRPFHAQTVQDLRSHYAYRIVEGDEGEAAVDLGDGDIVSLEEVAGYLLREIRESASLLLSEPVTRAVITCPAFYTERQRDAVRIAGELAGFVVERVLSEPTAAALNHGLGRDFATRRVAVYDLGGGTFDVSILEVDGSVYEVLATGGDTFLGGVDFDATIAELAVERLVAAGHPDPRPDPAAVARIMEAAERAKLSLSEVPATILHVDRLRVGAHEPFDVALPIHRNEVDPRLTPLLDRTIELVEDTCRRAELRPDEVDDVLLVGGQTRYPAVAEAVTRVFGRSPRASVNPDEAVALGAAQYAVGMNTIDNVVLIDALPMSIGVGLPGDRFLPVLHRDQRLPADGSCLLPTSRKNQRSMDVWFFQGEGQRVSQTEPLGRLEISDLPPGPIGSTTVVVEVRVTEESVLEVRAKDRAGGRVFTSRFATRSTPEQLRAKLGLPDPPASGPRASAPSRAWSWLTRLFR